MTETKSSNPGSAEVWITGIGLATSLGEGLDAHWDALNQRRVNVDEKSFAPHIVHPWAPINLDTQIPKKGDQRQMEAWQRIGTYAAGLALESAVVGISGPHIRSVNSHGMVSLGSRPRSPPPAATIMSMRPRISLLPLTPADSSASPAA